VDDVRDRSGTAHRLPGDDRCAPAATAAFLAADQVARQHRPATAHARVAPARFTAYRDAVAAAGRAFAVAEAEAWRQARGG
jgi:hypothetical protein